MGRLHNLLYDYDCEKLYSDRYGIYPSVTRDNRVYYPFLPVSDVRSATAYAAARTGGVQVDMYAKEAVFTSHTMLAADGTACAEKMERFSVSVQGDTLRINVRLSAPCDVRLHLPWYPLYDSFVTGDGHEHHIEYIRCGVEGDYYPDGYCRILPEKTVGLRDGTGMQAGINVTAIKGRIELKSKTLPEGGNSFYLSTDILSETAKRRRS